MPDPDGIMGKLSHHEILTLHAAVVSARLIESRDTLLVGIDPHFVAGLPHAACPSDQILRDLDALTLAGTLTDGTVPLDIWLANAVARTRSHNEPVLFRTMREERLRDGPQRPCRTVFSSSRNGLAAHLNEPSTERPYSAHDAEYARAVGSALARQIPEFSIVRRARVGDRYGVQQVFDFVFERTDALGVTVRYAIECRNSEAKIEGQELEQFAERLERAGMNKGLFFTTTGYQPKAMAVARSRGIALILYRSPDSAPTFLTKLRGGFDPATLQLRLPNASAWVDDRDGFKVRAWIGSDA